VLQPKKKSCCPLKSFNHFSFIFLFAQKSGNTHVDKPFAKNFNRRHGINQNGQLRILCADFAKNIDDIAIYRL